MSKYIDSLSVFLEEAPSDKGEAKLKVIQDISENFETLQASPHYSSFLESAVPAFLSFLEDGEPHFVSEYQMQQVRKAVLELLHRLPPNEHLRPYVRQILNGVFRLLAIDNEDNVLTCLRIIIELHKQYRPQFTVEVQNFLQFVRSVYKELPRHMEKIFEPRSQVKVKDLSEINVSNSPALEEIYAVTNFQSDKKNPDGANHSYSVLPKAKNSLKVLQELPIIVVLMYQIYKTNVQQEVADFIPIVMSTITLQPNENHRTNTGFNKEVLVEFMGAQVKTLSFLAYIIKLYQDLVIQHHDLLVNGLINLLTLCPMEVAYLRRELFIAARHIMATDLRFKFVPHMGKLFDEDILLGKGWTVNETMRPLAYSTLADLVHHVRQHLSLADLSKAVTFFSYHVHDESLPLSIQTMSCKLLFNLVESIRLKSESEGGNGREILMKMLDVLVYKFKIVSQVHVPYFTAKFNALAAAQNDKKPESELSAEDILNRGFSSGADTFGKEEGRRFGFPTAPMQNYLFHECRTLVKTVICAVKTISWGIASCKNKGVPADAGPTAAYKQFNVKETEVFLRLMKWGLLAIDIYAISGPVTNVNGQTVFVTQRPINTQGVRSKEEKEVLEHLAGAFTLLNTYTFRELFSVRIKMLVERIHENNAIQVVANNLLANPATSAVFATILVEFLLDKMPEMGDDVEKSNLYLRLFKLVFGSVSLFPAENEQMLKPHLREIVNRSMELALNAKDPYNYFLLLRALFRSIGGGSHDLLYQEFLPLLPSLLQGLNSLQSGLHKQHMKDLFVELCLTVPVRLSSLLPYLPMLMDPLVSALNGSPTLVSQGLRTLELCVDNLQPEFLYEHIQPVRADLMQALWRTLRNPNDSTATVAFRILGKFGGSNRKMLVEPQKLEYGDKTNQGPQVLLYFQDHKSPVLVPVEKPIESACHLLKSPTVELNYKREAWQLLKTFLVSSMVPDEDRNIVSKTILHHTLREQDILNVPLHKYIDQKSRHVHAAALSGLFVAASVKEMKREVYTFIIPLIRHYSMVAVTQQLGPFAGKYQGMDPYVLFDAVFSVLASEEPEFEKPVFFCLSILMNSLMNVVGSKERACSLPMIEYMSEKITTLCYERAWYSKMGGCNAINFLLDHMSYKWILGHHTSILKAMMFVLTDLTGEVSSGAVEAAKANLEKILRISVSIQEPHLQGLKQKSLADVTIEFVRQVTSSITNVREQSMKNLHLLADLQMKSLSAIIQPHVGVIADMIPPKKHLIRHQSLQSQLGILDGNSFCLNLSPKLFKIDVGIQEHRVFITELLSLSESDDAALLKLPCYKGVVNLIPVKISILKVLACVAGPQTKDKIVHIFIKALASTTAELQRAAFECMRKFLEENTIDLDMMSTVARPNLASLTSMKTVSMEGLRQASYMYQLFPAIHNGKIWETLLQILKRFLECALVNHSKSPNRTGSHELKIAVAIVDLFELVADQNPRYLDPLCKLCLQAEKALCLGKGCPLRPNLMKFLRKVPKDYITLVFSAPHIQQPEWTRFFIYFMEQPDADILRQTLVENTAKIIYCLSIKQDPTIPGTMNQFSEHDASEIQYLGVKCTSILCGYNEDWILAQPDIIQALRALWEKPDFHQGVQVSNGKLDVQLWKEPQMIAKLLLLYYKRHPEDIGLLFSLLLAFCGKSISQYQFLKEFLEYTVTTEYSVAWKRQAFFKFIEVFEDRKYPSELKAKIIQFVLIPCMAHCFEVGLGDEFVGSPPMPDADSPDNIVSMLLAEVIDAENPNSQSDHVRILLCQLSCLLVEVAAAHIHDASNKKQGSKLRRLMTFAWPCLLSKTCVDSSTKYYGHLLLSHIIAKFAIHKRIVLQVFHSLLKASVLEAKSVIKQALEIITPALPLRMEDGNTMLIHWTKKILVEEGHSLSQLMHILQLIVRHWKVYYPVRHLLIIHMVNSIQRLGFTQTSTLEHRKLAVELAEVIIKWELERIKTEGDESGGDKNKALAVIGTVAMKNEVPKSLERAHTDAVVNFLLRMACQVNEPTPTPGSPGELLSRRCVTLVKTVLKPEVWPSCDLKLAWFDKLLTTLETPQVNFQNICTAIELLTFITGILTKEQVLEHFKGLQKGIAACMTCQNSKVIRSVHNLMTKLMSIHPTDFPGNTSNTAKCDELEPLYGQVSKVVYEGLTNYEKLTTSNPSALLGPLMMLKSACTANPCYIDRLITVFMKVLQKLAREHLSPTPTDASMATELLIVSMDLVKNRVGVMGVEMRKAFIGTVLVSLIEKTTDSKVMQGIIKMLEEWMKNKNPIVVNQGPSSREKSILLVKLMQNAEKRFSADQELVGQFLELINFIYREDHLKTTELNAKLEPAFLSGLRCQQSNIRKKFFEVFDGSIRRRLHDRIMYILCSQNWEAMGQHYWIKQCIELLFSTVADVDLQFAPLDSRLPGIAHGIDFIDQADKDMFFNYPDFKGEPMDVETPVVQSIESDLNLLQQLGDGESQELADVITRIEDGFLSAWDEPHNAMINVKTFLLRQIEFRTVLKNTRLSAFVTPLIQLCHADTNLAEKMWISFFPRAWKIFSEKQQLALANEMTPFMCSGVHVIQKDCSPSALNTFAEALCQCIPSVSIPPVVHYYLGKSHNLWHRMALLLEQLALDGANTHQLKAKKDQADCYDFEPSTSAAAQIPPAAPHQDVMDSLAELYAALKEEDLWAGLWQRKAKYAETNIGIAFVQQGYYEKAQAAFELSMSKSTVDFADDGLPNHMIPEFKLWETQWLKCAKELSQWDVIQEYGKSAAVTDPLLVLESIWRVPDWPGVKESLAQVELSCPKDAAWRVHLYRGYLSICFTEDQNLSIVDRYVEAASQLCIKDWRRLPHLVSNVHVSILQAAQQIVELNEATQIHQGLVLGRTNTVHDMKAVVKTWRNRLPCISDDLSHWSDIFTWRQHHYQFIASHFDSQSDQSGGSQTMLGVHASAQAICHFGKIARKHNMTTVCLDSLAKIYSIPSVPIVDCFQKIKQQVKCYIQQAQILGKNELTEALEIVESTNLKYFSKEMTAEFFTLKGLLQTQIGRSDEANKSFSASCQLNDSLNKTWGTWGDYLESVFTRDPRNMGAGIASITSFMQACRHQNETKARKYIAKIIWLLMYDDEKGTLSDSVDKYSSGVPPIQWLPWVPQLLTSLVRHDGKMVINLLNSVGRMYPQAVYFPIRTLYLTLKIEQREKVRNAEFAAAANPNTPSASSAGGGDPADSESSTPTTPAQPTPSQPAEAQAIKATPSMWRCSRIMHMQRDLHPTVLASLEGIVDQIIWFRENWFEEVMRQLKIGLAKCYAIAFENRANVLDASITPQLQNFVRKLVSTFGHASAGAPGGAGTTSMEALLRSRTTIPDPAFLQMKHQFSVDFDGSAPGAIKLHNLILRLRKWIKILEQKTKAFAKPFLMEDKFRFLQNFSTQMAEIELPGEFLIPKHVHYYVKIARFQPRIEVVHKHNTSARRIFIRGHNGKIYPYLIVNDSGLADARREERVMQMTRMLNHYLGRQKITAKRNLKFTVPKVVAVSPQMRLVEDNPASLSLLDVFKHSCSKRGVEYDAAITRYYDKIAAIQTRGAQVTHQVLREILRDIQANLVPRTMMKEWALNTFATPSDYWMFRKTFTLQLCLAGFAEYAFHLTRLNPEMMYLHQDSGMVNISYFKFELDDVTGDLESNRPVPFRLTPNISEFITSFGVSGPFVSSMISLARCLVYPNYKLQAILRAILRDEMISWLQKKQSDREMISAASGSREPVPIETDAEPVINMVTKSVTGIMMRLQNLSSFDGLESKVSTLVAAANSHDNLCRMDPAWHPWL